MNMDVLALLLGGLLTLNIATSASAATLRFPEGFKWCVATAGHQIEGYNDNSDWWAWEQLPGKIRNGEKSGAASDHWNHLEEDTALMKAINVKQYRFSMEWAKIEPRPGEFSEEAAEHYRKELRLLADAGIEPMVTLFHWALPLWLADRGGWENPGTPALFERYARFVAQNIGPDVRDWITLNEPMVYTVTGYAGGITPPGKTDLKNIAKPVRNLLKGHALAYHALHQVAQQNGKSIRVGIAHHLRYFQAWKWWNPLDRFLTGIINQGFNWAFPEAVESGVMKLNFPFVMNIEEEIPGLAGTQDFFGINYYSRNRIKFSTTAPGYFELRSTPKTPRDDLDWETFPKGITTMVRQAIHRLGNKPVLITENGLADAADSRRSIFIRDHLAALHALISEGIGIEGYCHWSLIDNFEWTNGFGPRLGLYSIDYATQRRSPRLSAYYFSAIAESNSLETR